MSYVLYVIVRGLKITSLNNHLCHTQHGKIMKIKELDSINDYQGYFDHLYGKPNSSRDWQEIFGYISRTTGYLSRGLIKGKYSESDFIRPISWLFALANKLDVSLQDSFYKKYPNICHYCLERVCCCFRTDKQPLKNRPAYKLIEERKVQFNVVQNTHSRKNFDNAVSNISTIYPNNEVVWHFSGPWMNCSKLFEEVAELHEAVCKYLNGQKTKSNVEEEIADVLAWVISAWISAYRGKSLDEEFINYFYGGCPVCHLEPCDCSQFDSRIQGLVDAEKFKELRNLFEELEALSPNAVGDIEDLITSLKAVEDTQDEAVANAAISEAKNKVSSLNLKGKLDATEDTVKKAASIGKSISTILSMLS